MVDDILLTPEEQDERAKQWLKDNGLAIILGIALGLGAVFGYNAYQDKLKTDAEAASVLYDEVLEAIKNSELADIQSQVSNLKADFGATSYAGKAVLLRARQLAVSDLDAALAELQWVADNADETGLRHTARIRQAKILLVQDKLDQARQIASQTPYDGFDSNYQEILGDIAVKEANFSAARDHYQQAIDRIGRGDLGYSSILQLKLSRLPREESGSEEPETSAPVTE